MIVRPIPPVRVNSPAGPGEAVCYMGETVIVRLPGGALHSFGASEVSDYREVRMDLSTEIRPEAKVEFDAPIRRGDVVVFQNAPEHWRVVEVEAVSAKIVPVGGGNPFVVPQSELTRVNGLKCPGHVIEIATRRCRVCGLSVNVILQSGERYATEGRVEEYPTESVKSPEMAKIPAWVEDVYQAILKRPGQRVSVMIGDGEDADYVRILTAGEFLSAMGIE